VGEKECVKRACSEGVSERRRRGEGRGGEERGCEREKVEGGGVRKVRALRVDEGLFVIFVAQGKVIYTAI